MKVNILNLQKEPSRGVLRKFTGEHPCWSVISIKLVCNFIKITLRRGSSPVNLLHIFRTPFPKNISERLLLNLIQWNLCKADTSIRRTVWQERIALLCCQAISEKISIKRTLFCHQWCPVYRDSTVISRKFQVYQER